MKAGVQRGASAHGLAAVAVLLFFAPVAGQEGTRQWERRAGATRPPLTAFHSTQAINLPTAETLARGEWQFEIAHRFQLPVSDGADAFWGLDGPVFMRLGLGYAPLDRPGVLTFLNGIQGIQGTSSTTASSS